MKTYHEISDDDLSPTETEALAEDSVAEGNDFFDKDEHLALWAAEARRRLEELRSGAVKAIPGDEVFASIRSKYQ